MDKRPENAGENLEKKKFAKGLYVSWEVEDVCNLGCDFCYALDTENDLYDHGKKKKLTLEEIKAGIDNLTKTGVSSFNIEGGEPTIREDIVDIVEHAKRNGMRTFLSTNGMFLLKPRPDGGPLAEKLIGKLDVLSISMDGDTPELNNVIRKKKNGDPSDHFEKIVGFLDWYRDEWNRRRDTPKPLYNLKINIVVTSQNIHAVQNIGNLLQDRIPAEAHAQLKIVQVHPRGLGRDATHLHVSDVEFSRLAKTMEETFGAHFQVTVRPYTEEVYPFIVISSQGDAIVPQGDKQAITFVKKGEDLRPMNVLRPDFYDSLQTYVEKHPDFLEKNKGINTYEQKTLSTS
jgi:MoaA/NifB/PqqE/SkfB family radical SAM enzyme